MKKLFVIGLLTISSLAYATPEHDTRSINVLGTEVTESCSITPDCTPLSAFGRAGCLLKGAVWCSTSFYTAALCGYTLKNYVSGKNSFWDKASRGVIMSLVFAAVAIEAGKTGSVNIVNALS